MSFYEHLYGACFVKGMLAKCHKDKRRLIQEHDHAESWTLHYRISTSSVKETGIYTLHTTQAWLDNSCMIYSRTLQPEVANTADGVVSVATELPNKLADGRACA